MATSQLSLARLSRSVFPDTQQTPVQLYVVAVDSRPKLLSTVFV